MIKYSGAGNTFLIMQGMGYSPNIRAKLVQQICNCTSGVCADGALFLDSGDKNCHWVWDFYNSDGSNAEMCGNAARCATQFVFDELKHKEESVVFSTGAGLIRCGRIGVQYEVEMPDYRILDPSKKVVVSGSAVATGLSINSGVPHFVLEKPIDEGYRLYRELGREIRSHSDFQPQGTNVTFFEKIDLNSIRAVSFERGVEDFTLACGTGAVAAAVAWNLLSQQTQVIVKMPGGDLKIVLPGNNKAIMVGSSEKIAEIKWMDKL
jgi:diaminopimelate epimerase